MPPWLGIALLWAGFAGAHLYLSGDDVRPRLVARLGPDVFRGVYSLVVLVWFGWLVWYWWHHKHTGPLLWTTLGPPVLARALNHVLMFLAFALLVPGRPAGVCGAELDHRRRSRCERRPRPAAHHAAPAADGDSRSSAWRTYWSTARSATSSSSAASRSSCGSGRATRTRAWRATARAIGELIAQTSVVPFGAILAGRQRLVAAELPWGAMAAGLVLAIRGAPVARVPVRAVAALPQTGG